MRPGGRGSSNRAGVPKPTADDMRIENDFEDQVSREFLARRAAMVAELSGRTAPTRSGHRATAPATQVAGDEVHISPEARAAVWTKDGPAGQPLRPFPSPSEVVAALRALTELPRGASPGAALDVLRVVLAGLARGLPGTAPTEPQTPASVLADAVVRLLLEPRSSAGTPPPSQAEAAAILQAVQNLVAAGVEASAGQQTVLERATAALLLAVLRWRGAVSPAPAEGPRGEAFPPALLSLFAGQATQTRPRRRRRRGDEPDGATDEETERWDGDPEEGAGYRSSPWRT